MVTLCEAQADYINRWKKNARQHFLDGDYDWAASLVAKTSAKRVLEIGCGVGYSTLAIANRDIQVLSIDSIPEAIEETRRLLESFNFSVGKFDDDGNQRVLLKQADVIEDFEEVCAWAEWVDLVLICNPGGKMETELTDKEKEMLLWGRFTDEELKDDPVTLLHKWAVLIAAVRLTKADNKEIVVIDRGSLKEIDSILDVIQEDMGLRGKAKTVRQIQTPPQDGVQLSHSDETLYWGAGWYEPACG